MAKKVNLSNIRTKSFVLPMELSTQLRASADANQCDQARRAYEADIGKDDLGVGAYLDGGEVRFSYPSLISERSEEPVDDAFAARLPPQRVTLRPCNPKPTQCDSLRYEGK